MTGFKSKSRHLILGVGLAFSLGLASQSLALTSEQKKELFEQGTITKYDEKGNKLGHWEVKFMPGFEIIGDRAAAHWEHAADLMSELGQKDSFWRKKFAGKFLDGVHHMKKCAVDYGVQDIADEFHSTQETNRQLAGSFGAHAKRLKNWLKFGATCIKDVVIMAVGTPLSAAYALLAPTAQILYLPVAAATEAVVSGTLWPALSFTWNGTAWVMVQGSSEPKEGDITVTFVPEQVKDLEVQLGKSDESFISPDEMMSSEAVLDEKKDESVISSAEMMPSELIIDEKKDESVVSSAEVMPSEAVLDEKKEDESAVSSAEVMSSEVVLDEKKEDESAVSSAEVMSSEAVINEKIEILGEKEATLDGKTVAADSEGGEGGGMGGDF
ncbi:MAG: hypothetical protein KA436_05415 [Oligoflexales bacterium]|nr:hypothetical protein [Oligoflexales bacterium]